MLRDVQRALRRHRLAAPGDHLLVAVSGGADSVCLLTLLSRLAGDYPLRLTVVHLDHQLRAASPEDAVFVRRLAASLGWPVVEVRRDVGRLARRQGISIEMAARKARYAFFAETATRLGAQAVATAHTADDQAETLLMKLARGTGPAGLAAIPRDTVLHGVRVIRPLLDMGGEAVRAFLRRDGIVWREDQSNRDLCFLRNRVRHEILPLLRERLNPRVGSALCRLADLAAEENSWLAAPVADAMAACRADAVGADGGAALSAAALRRQPLALRRRVLRGWLVGCGVAAEATGSALIARMVALVAGRAGSGRVPVAGGGAVVREYDRVRFRAVGGSVPPEPFRQRLRVPGETLLPAQGLRVTVEPVSSLRRDACRRPGSLPAFVTLSRQAVGRRALYLRSWRAGDRMRPLGLNGTRKLQDIFVDAKVPTAMRGRIPLLECANDIVWVPAYRVAHGWEVPDGCASALLVSVSAV